MNYLKFVNSFLLFHLIMITSTLSQPTANWPVYPLEDSSEIELKYIRSGIQLDLQCGGKNKHRHSNLHKSHNITWLYKHCGFGYNVTACDKLPRDTTWKTLHCDEGRRPKSCRRLVLPNTTEDDSGLYKCISLTRETEMDTLKTYQLEVIDAKNIPPPQLLNELPENTTVLESNSAVLQCRVLSRLEPTVVWFRRQDMDSDTDSIIQHTTAIQHLNEYYERLNDSSIKPLKDNIYLSKLIISRTTQNDNGYYVCIAISMHGYSVRGAYLTVLPAQMSGMKRYEGGKSMHLALLFLIPAALALVPASVWFCCWWRRRCKKLPQGEVEQPVNNNSTTKEAVRKYEYKPVAESQPRHYTII